MIHTCIFYPNIWISMSSVTKENAAGLLEEKFIEILDFYPDLENEIIYKSFSQDKAKIIFKNNSKIDCLGNTQASKGKRRKRLSVEESAQTSKQLFDDVLSPIVNVPRRTMGKNAEINHEELNGQIHFYTTSWYRNSDEFQKVYSMFDDMAELKGKLVLGSDWILACSLGRGENKAQILDRKANMPYTFWAFNFESRWLGSAEGGIVDINKLMTSRVIENFEDKCDGIHDYIFGVDVARSHSSANNMSSVAVIKLYRGKDNTIKEIHLVNIYNIMGTQNFTSQSVTIKKLYNKFKPKTIILDTNGLGRQICPFIQ